MSTEVNNKNMRIVMTIFAPFIVAIGIRLILFIIGLITFWVGEVAGHRVRDFAENIAGFDTFSWDESWLFWVLVLIGTFIVELIIWNDDKWEDLSSLL